MFIVLLMSKIVETNCHAFNKNFFFNLRDFSHYHSVYIGRSLQCINVSITLNYIENGAQTLVSSTPFNLSWGQFVDRKICFRDLITALCLLCICMLVDLTIFIRYKKKYKVINKEKFLYAKWTEWWWRFENRACKTGFHMNPMEM